MVAKGPTMIHHHTHRDRVLDECRRIALLARALAGAADRQFAAQIDDEDFETGDGSAYNNGLRSLRIQIERIAQRTEGLDPKLDEAFHAYHMDVLRADPGADRPALFRVN
jgi:hypothetical protein